jgi:hypothetical protein
MSEAVSAPLMAFKRPPCLYWLPLPSLRSRTNRCGLCGCSWPRIFDVPTPVWHRYVPPEYRRHMLCIACWHLLVEVTDGGAFQATHGGPLPLWSPAWRVRHRIPPDRPDWPLSPDATPSESECRAGWLPRTPAAVR